VTPLSLLDVPEVLLVQVVPSGEVRMVPELPTVTNNPVEVLLGFQLTVSCFALEPPYLI